MTDDVDHYRGFWKELQAERRGHPTYPVWRDLPGADLLPERCGKWMPVSRDHLWSPAGPRDGVS